MAEVELVKGSVRRVCQLTGERDRTLGVPVPGDTSRIGLVGTDLGASVDLGDRVVFLFGDTWPDSGLSDTLGWTAAIEPAGSLSLEFPTDEDGRWKPFVLLDAGFPGGRRPTGVFHVPTGGFAHGGRLYVFYSQGHGEPGPVMGACVLARAEDRNDLTQLRVVYEFSNLAEGGRFLNAAPVPASPSSTGPDMLYVWGSGEYRHSYAYVARVPFAAVDAESRAAWRYWDGNDWVPDERCAVALFTDQPEQIGELSAAWIAPFHRWIVTYQLGEPRGVWFRTAPGPAGPYSPPQLLYSPDWPDVGYRSVMHASWEDGGPEGTDLLYDRGRGEYWGGEYGPYLVDRFTRQLHPGHVRIAFTLSTWNPYQSHLFTATLVDGASEGRQSGEVPDPAPTARPSHPRPERGHDTGGVAFLHSTFGTPAGPGNFELLAPSADGGLRFRARDNSQAAQPWGPVADVALGPGGAGDPVRYAAITLLQSGDRPAGFENRLYAAARVGGRVVYVWREPNPPWTWHGPFPVIAVEPDDRRVACTGVTGNPVLVHAHGGAQRANWELIVPSRQGGVDHFWRDNDPDFPLLGDWRTAPRILTEVGTVDAVALFESQLSPDAFALEVVARVGGRLCYAWRDSSLAWHGPLPFVADGLTVTGVCGAPSMIQSSGGARKRNFELVTPLLDGGIAHLWRDNDSDNTANWRWHRLPQVLDDERRYEATSLVQGPFGASPSNLELMARCVDGTVMHLWRETATARWHGPHHVL